MTHPHNTKITFAALLKNGEIFSSEERGVKPMLTKLVEDEAFFAGSTIIDKVVGKAAALLAIKAGVAFVSAGVISIPALEVLKKAELPFKYNVLVPRIENRSKTGLCPMETLTLSMDDPEEAFILLKQKLLDS